MPVTESMRDAAIRWLNSKNHDFYSGLSILEQSGFKPAVSRRLRSLGDKPVNREHLMENMRQYVRFVGKKVVPDTDAEIGVINGEQPKQADTEMPDSKNESIIALAKHPETIHNTDVSIMVIQYAKDYKLREKLHRQLIDMGEVNDDASVDKRKAIIEQMEYLSDNLEKAYPVIRNYLDNGVYVPQTDEPDTGAGSVPGEPGDNVRQLDDLSKAELQKMLKSAKTKVLRKTNMLLYQQETKAAVENPMPECPKRTKYETAIAELQSEISALEYAIARKG